MSSGYSLDFEPWTFKFPFELRELIFFPIQFHNGTEKPFAFKFQQDERTRGKEYNVQPPKGVVSPISICKVIVRMHGIQPASVDVGREREFFVENVGKYIAATTAANSFSVELLCCIKMDEVIFRMDQVSPPQPPYQVNDGPDGVSWSTASLVYYEKLTGPEIGKLSRLTTAKRPKKSSKIWGLPPAPEADFPWNMEITNLWPKFCS